MRVSVVIPAKNEENGLRTLLPRLCEISGIDEVVVNTHHQSASLHQVLAGADANVGGDD